MVGRHSEMGRAFLEHAQDGAEHAVDGAKRMVRQLRPAKPVEMAKELVCAVDEMDDHASISCSIRGMSIRSRAVRRVYEGQISCSSLIKEIRTMRFMMIVKASNE